MKAKNKMNHLARFLFLGWTTLATVIWRSLGLVSISFGIYALWHIAIHGGTKALFFEIYLVAALFFIVWGIFLSLTAYKDTEFVQVLLKGKKLHER